MYTNGLNVFQINLNKNPYPLWTIAKVGKANKIFLLPPKICVISFCYK